MRVYLVACRHSSPFARRTLAAAVKLCPAAHTPNAASTNLQVLRRDRLGGCTHRLTETTDGFRNRSF